MKPANRRHAATVHTLAVCAGGFCTRSESNLFAVAAAVNSIGATAPIQNQNGYVPGLRPWRATAPRHDYTAAVPAAEQTTPTMSGKPRNPTGLRRAMQTPCCAHVLRGIRGCPSGKVYRPGPYRSGLRPALCAAQYELGKQRGENYRRMGFAKRDWPATWQRQAQRAQKQAASASSRIMQRYPHTITPSAAKCVCAAFNAIRYLYALRHVFRVEHATPTRSIDRQPRGPQRQRIS